MDYPVPEQNNRIGVHYFPDTVHYREADLNIWIPEMKKMGVQWVTLRAPLKRAIPEDFIRGVIAAGIEPVLHFRILPDRPPTLKAFSTLLESYASWGVRYIALFDRPNLRSSWSPITWTQPSLVERFLDILVPLINRVVDFGMYPVFPPLEPGGDYWDLAFLRTALPSIERRTRSRVMNRMVIGVYAWADDHPLDWGTGGPERWPGAQPYETPEGQEDQTGFRVFEWYKAETNAAIGRTLPMIMMGMGVRKPSPDHASENLTIAKLMARDEVEGQEPIPEEVIGGNFWLLAAGQDSPYSRQGWYRLDGRAPLPIVQRLVEAEKKRIEAPLRSESSEATEDVAHIEAKCMCKVGEEGKKKHYLLMAPDGSINGYPMDVFWNYVNKNKPTVGFSVVEAMEADKVTLAGNPNVYEIDVVDRLRNSGCQIEIFNGMA